MAGGAKRAGFIGWLVAFVVPPAVAGGLGQQFIAHHTAWAFVIGVAYEAAVAITGFFAVIAKDAASRWQKRLADKTDLFLQRKAPRFERWYRELVLGSLRFMDHKGLATLGPFTPELDSVFVNVALIPSPPQRISPAFLPGPADQRAGRRALADFLDHPEPAVLAVVGGPGSGKTMLLRHAAAPQHACARFLAPSPRAGPTLGRKTSPAGISAGSAHSADSPATLTRALAASGFPGCRCTFASRGPGEVPVLDPGGDEGGGHPAGPVAFPAVGAALTICCPGCR